MTALLKEKIKRGKSETTKRGKIISPEQAEKTMRRPEFRASKMGFQSQYAFLPGVGLLDWEQVKTTKWFLLATNLHSTEFYTGINYHAQFTQGWCRDI